MTYQTSAHTEPGLGELFSRLSSQASQLFRQEMELAQAEMTGKVTRAGRNLAFIGAGAALGMGGLYALIAAAILLLGQYMEVWLAAALVGLVLAIVAALLVRSGLEKLKSIDPTPRQTIESMRENKEWLTNQI